jgi:hypothetical protein
MSVLTPSGVAYPALTDSPNGPSQLQALALSLEGKVIPPFASAAARAAAITGPTDGMITYRTDTRLYERYSSSAGTYSQFIGGRVQMKRITSVQPITTGGSATAVSFNSTDYNPLGWTTSTSGVTIPIACWIDVRFGGEMAGNATGRRFACILRNGGEASEVNRFTAPVNTAANASGLVLPGVSINCAAGDVIGIGVFQDSGVSLNLSIGACLTITIAL